MYLELSKCVGLLNVQYYTFTINLKRITFQGISFSSFISYLNNLDVDIHTKCYQNFRLMHSFRNAGLKFKNIDIFRDA